MDIREALTLSDPSDFAIQEAMGPLVSRYIPYKHAEFPSAVYKEMCDEECRNRPGQ